RITSRSLCAFAGKPRSARLTARPALDRGQAGRQRIHDFPPLTRRHGKPGGDLAARAPAAEAVAGFLVDRADEDARGFDRRRHERLPAVPHGTTERETQGGCEATSPTDSWAGIALAFTARYPRPVPGER